MKDTMKRIFLALGLALVSLHGVASPQVGVSVHLNQPGLYGRVDVGNIPAPPALLFPRPVLITHHPAMVERHPIYLHVPRHHARHWRRHCGYYQACGQSVYFVREDWYRRHYGHRHDHRGWREHRREERYDRFDRHDRHERHWRRHHRHWDRHDRHGHHGRHGHHH